MACKDDGRLGAKVGSISPNGNPHVEGRRGPENLSSSTEQIEKRESMMKKRDRLHAVLCV